jgi:hypothetical protein
LSALNRATMFDANAVNAAQKGRPGISPPLG